MFRLITWSGELINEPIISEIDVGKDTYCKIKICGSEKWFIRKKINSDKPLIINQLKTLFGLNKLSIVTMFIKNKKYILIKVKDPFIKPCLSLNQYVDFKLDISEIMMEQIRFILAFKYIVMADNFSDNSIKFIDDNFASLDYCQTAISSKKTFIKWFQMAPRAELDDTMLILLKTRSESDWITSIDNIFEKFGCAEELAAYRNDLIHNIINRLN